MNLIVLQRRIASSSNSEKVSASCDSLEAHFDDRQALRGQERQALTDAIEARAGATASQEDWLTGEWAVGLCKPTHKPTFSA